jgi:hypothetical protein
MNKIINKTKGFIAATGIIIMLGLSTSSFASIPGTFGELKFMGTSNNLPVFQLVLNSSLKTEYTVTVRDSEKRILFSEKLKGGEIRRTYKLNTDGFSWINGTTFEVTNKSTGETSVYEVNGTASLVEYVSVAKL